MNNLIQEIRSDIDAIRANFRPDSDAVFGVIVGGIALFMFALLTAAFGK